MFANDSTSIIANILQDYALSTAPQVFQPLEAGRQLYDGYFITYRFGEPRNYLSDSIRYFFNHIEVWRERKVAFVIQENATHVYTLIIEYTDFSRELALWLKDRATVETALENDKWVYFTQLYGQLSVKVIATFPFDRGVLVAQLQAELLQYYQSAIQFLNTSTVNNIQDFARQIAHNFGLRESWSLWFKRNASEALNYVYQRSLAGAYGNLAEWITREGVAWLVNRAIGEQLPREQLPYLAKITASTLTGAYMYYVGITSFFPMLAIVCLAEQLHHKATGIPLLQANLPSVQMLVRAGDLLVAVIQAWFYQNYEMLVRSGSIISSSIIFEKYLTPKVIRMIEAEHPVNERDKQQLQYILSMIGIYCGSGLFSIGQNVFRKFIARPKIHAVIQQELPPGSHCDPPEFASWANPMTWLTASDQASITTREPTGHYAYDCVIDIDGVGGVGSGWCSNTSWTPVRPQIEYKP